MPEVAVYYDISDKAVPERAFLAYIVLDNGTLWGVRFEGTSEESVKAKALACWQREQAKAKQLEPHVSDGETTNSTHSLNASELRIHHNAGKVWMIRRDADGRISDKRRVTEEQASALLWAGWERGGPRSK